MGPKLNRDWVGLRVRLKRPAKNGFGSLPAGTVGTVDGYSGVRGIGIETDKCNCCGVSVFIVGLSRGDFEILTPESEWKDTRGRGSR